MESSCQTLDLQQLHGRQLKLEAQNRRMRKATGILCIVSGLSLLAHFASYGTMQPAAQAAEQEGDKGKVIKANEIRIVDDDGDTRIWMGMHNARGKRFPGIAIVDKKGNTRLDLMLGNDSDSFIGFRDIDGEYRMMLQSTADDINGLAFNGRKEGQIKLGIGPNGCPKIAVLSKEEDENSCEASIYLFPDKAAMFSIMDKNGEFRSMMQAKWNGESKFELYDKNGKSKWKASR